MGICHNNLIFHCKVPVATYGHRTTSFIVTYFYCLTTIHQYSTVPSQKAAASTDVSPSPIVERCIMLLAEECVVSFLIKTGYFMLREPAPNNIKIMNYCCHLCFAHAFYSCTVTFFTLSNGKQHL